MLAAIQLCRAGLTFEAHPLGDAQTSAAEAPQLGGALGLAVRPDGTCYVVSSAGVTLYRDDKIVGQLQGLGPGRVMPSGAIAITPKHVFIAAAMAEGSLRMEGVARYTHDGLPAPFPEGRGPDRCLVSLHETVPPPAASGDGTSAPVAPAAPISGLASTQTHLWMANPYKKSVQVMDLDTLEVQRHFAVDEPGALLVAEQKLWLVEKKNVSVYSLSGRRIVEGIIEEVDAAALALDSSGRLLVLDRGMDHRVKVYNIAHDPVEVRTFGELFGIFGDPSPGLMGPLRLAHPMGLGCDAAGQLYIASQPSPGTSVLRAYTADRSKLLWETALLPLTRGGVIDPATDGKDLWDVFDHFQLDTNKAPGSSWKWAAHTLTPFRYPGDLRFTKPESLRSIGLFSLGKGKRRERFFAAWDSSGDTVAFYHQGPAADVLTPVGLFGRGLTAAELTSQAPLQKTPAQASIWLDKSGDGVCADDEILPNPEAAQSPSWTVTLDSRGALWKVAPNGLIRQWPLASINEHGVPYYDPEDVIKDQVPGQLCEISWVRAFPEKDTLYLLGRTAPGAPTLTLLRVQQWSTPGQRQAHPVLTLPAAAPGLSSPGLDVAGDLCFISLPGASTVTVYALTDGAKLGELSPPQPALAQLQAHSSTSLQAHARADGTYLVWASGSHQTSWVYHVTVEE